jgi:hypothetical protein
MAASARRRRDPRDGAETKKRRRGATAIEEVVTNAEAVTAEPTAGGEGVTTAGGAAGVTAVVVAVEVVGGEADTNKVAASMAVESMDDATKVAEVHAVDIATADTRAEDAADTRGSVEGATSLGGTSLGASIARSVTTATTGRAIASIKNTNAPMSSSFNGHRMTRRDSTKRLTGMTSNSRTARRNRPMSGRLRKNSMCCSVILAKSRLMR